MPPIDKRPPKRKPKPAARSVAVGRGADTINPTLGPPAPKPKPTGVFKGAPKPATAPITISQGQATEKAASAERKLPRAPIAAPPVIRNPTPEQVEAAKTQIVTTIRTAVGASGSGAQRNQRRDALLRQIDSDPAYGDVKKSFTHWSSEVRKIAGPQTKSVAKPGPAPRKAKVGIGPISASINLTAAGQAVTNAAEKAAPGLVRASAEAKFAKNAISDIAHLPLMVPQTAYEMSAAAYEAAGGDTDRAKKILKGLTEGVYGLAVQGKWGELEDYVRDHPINAILELRGGKGVVGRGAGAALRAGVAGETGRRAASTKRADIALSDEGARVADRQHYSPDVMTKFVQVLAEKARGKEGKTVVRDHRLRRRADFESDTAAATSRAIRQDEASKAQDAKPKGPLAEVVGLVVQGVVRPKTLEADLRKELGRLDRAHATAEFSTGAQKRQNRVTADAIRSVLENPAAMNRIGEAAQSGRANVRAINDLEARAVEQGAITPERAGRAKLFPAAQAHLDAEYSDAPFRAAREREVAAGRRLRSATSQQQQARVTYARRASSAQRKLAETKRAYLRGDETYSKLEATHGQAKARKEKLRAALREAEATKKPVEIKLGGDTYRLTAAQARTMLDAASVAQRSAASSLAARARVLHDKPLVRTIKSGPNQGKRQLTGKAKVKRAERDVLAARAARDKPKLQTVPLARAAFDEARAERRAAQTGGTDSLNVAGRQLPNEEIRRAVGEDVAHLPHHTQQRGARAHYQTAFAGRKNLDSSKKRTGAAFEKGAVDVSYDAVKEHRIRLRGVTNRIAEHDRIIHSIAIKGPGGKMMTWDQAEKIASNASDKGAKLVPYRAVPGSYDRARMQEIVSRQGASEMPVLEKMVESEFANRLKEPAAGDRTARNVVLVPEQIVNQLLEQHAISGTRGKAGNVAADTFRRVVLPFSTKWLTGNIVEAGVRLGAVGAGPNAYRIGRKLLKEVEKVDAEQAIRVKAALTGGLLFGNRGLTVKRVSEHFEGTSMAKPAAAVTVAGQLPVVKQLASLMKGYTDGVFAFNRSIESSAQVAALGKWAKREMQEMGASWYKANVSLGKALEDVANGQMDSKNIHDAARYVDQTLGQYSRYSPPMRRFIQQAAPFLPWYINAARFVFWTLPAKHPIKTGLYANVAANLQEDYDASHKGLPPGDLRGDIVTGDGTVLPFGRYLPTGAFGSVFGGGNEQVTALVDPLFPQFKSAALAAFGMNFGGKKAKIAPEDREGNDVPGAVRASMAFNSLLEAFVPAVGIGKRVREGGKTGWDNSTIWDPETKPGTVKGGAANRILNPFRPSPIKARGTATAAKPAARTAAPAPSLEDELLDNLGQTLGDAQSRQALEDELLNNLYGDG